MRDRSIRTAVILLAILVLSAGSATALPKGQPGCIYTCDRRLDTTECKTNPSGTFLASRTCEVVPNCVLYAVDPDGTGPQPPTFMMTCTYECAMEHCIWV
jgi:hypothetical protein